MTTAIAIKHFVSQKYCEVRQELRYAADGEIKRINGLRVECVGYGKFRIEDCEHYLSTFDASVHLAKARPAEIRIIHTDRNSFTVILGDRRIAKLTTDETIAQVAALILQASEWRGFPMATREEELAKEQATAARHGDWTEEDKREWVESAMRNFDEGTA